MILRKGIGTIWAMPNRSKNKPVDAVVVGVVEKLNMSK